MTRLTELQLKRAYKDSRTLAICSRQIYPIVVRQCTYIHGGNRQWMAGGTPALVRAMECFKAFVKEYEHGDVTLQTFDAVMWAAHNNGYMADKFIKARDEWEAVAILNRIGEITRYP